MQSGITLPPAPLLLDPVFQPRPWGGTELATVLDKDLPAGPPIGEAWEVSDRPEGSASVRSGPLAGRTVAELMSGASQALVGLSGADRFPLLFKFLDCREVLSLQVHPDDCAAAPYGDLGKEEAWYVLKADPGAHIYLGFSSPTTPAAVREAIAQGSLDRLLRRVDVAAGDVFHLPAGTVHAIGPGLVLAEIQQSSNLTYRLYDWGRMGLDGKPRELHLDQGLAVMDFGPWQAPVVPKGEPGSPLTQLVEGTAFRLWRLALDGQWQQPTDGRPMIVVCLSGRATVSGEALGRGRTALIPAVMPSVTLEGQAEILIATCND